MDIHIGAQAEKWDTGAERLRRLAHPLRLALLTLLRQRGEVCVCGIAAALAAEQATLSRHLRILKDGQLVRSRRDGANVFYSLNGETARTLLRQLEELLGKRDRGAEPRR
jgi:ArsR family transcriptional regulator